ncbi:hypothetical protein D3C73_752800 [compost metagenome]
MPPDIAEQQVAMQVIQRDTERQDAARTIGDQLALNRQRCRIDEHSAGFGFPQIRLGEHHPRCQPGRGRGPHGKQPRRLSDRCPRRRDLLRQWTLRAGSTRHQLIAVKQALDLRREHIKRSGYRGDKQERPDEQADIKVQARDELPDGGKGRLRGFSLHMRLHRWMLHTEAPEEKSGKRS